MVTRGVILARYDTLGGLLWANQPPLVLGSRSASGAAGCNKVFVVDETVPSRKLAIESPLFDPRKPVTSALKV